MRVLIKTCESLSAVVRALSQAHLLHQAGHTVFVSALPRFHDFFRCVGYCKPVNPFVKPPEVDETQEVSSDHFDPAPIECSLWFNPDYYHLQPWPIVSIYGIGWDPDCAASVDGVLAQANDQFGDRPYYILTQDQNFWDDGIHVCPLRLRDLPGLIAQAPEFWAPDSTALNIAYSVRPASSTFRIEHEILPVQ